MEQVLEHHEIMGWASDVLIFKLMQAFPDSTDPEDKDKIRRLTADKIRSAGGLTGMQLIHMMMDSSKPGGLQTHEHPTFLRVFGNLEERRALWEKSKSGVRTMEDAIKTIFHGLVLASCQVAVLGVETMIYNVIGQDARRPEFDCWFSIDESWCIASGTQVRDKTHMDVYGSYTSPCGWLRLALDVTAEAAGRGLLQDGEWSQWHKAYHGTAVDNIHSIVENGILRGDGRHGKAGAGKKSVIYCTPSIEYASHFVYTSVQHMKAAGVEAMCRERSEDASPSSSAVVTDWSDVLSEAARNGTHPQFVFELRVKPGSYRVQGNTLCSNLWPDWDLGSKRLPFDMFCLQHNLEWIVERPEDVLCTGVMVRQLKISPEEYNKDRIAAMKAHVQWDEGAKTATRPRCYGGLTAGQAAVWEYNGAPSDGHTLSYDADALWERYSAQDSDLIERAYQEYQRFVFLGRPDGAPGPYYVDFGNECQPCLELPPEQRRADPDKKQDWRRRAVRRVAA